MLGFQCSSFYFCQMIQLVTQVPVQPLKNPIDYQSKVFSMGSCFAEHMSAQLEYFGFSTLTNPFGIIFNTISIQQLIKRIVHQEFYTSEDVFLHNELWQSFEIHSALSGTDQTSYLNECNQRLVSSKAFLQSATHFILTLGTSWVYRHKGHVVANCHKVPNSHFEKSLLSTAENTEALQQIIALVRQLNPNIQFLFTVSPVRHIKDGYLENQISKGNLLQAVYTSLQEDEKVYYFPSYEIVLDELRDYRFFAADLIHPNALAIEYIWERFTQSAISTDVHSIMQEVQALKRALQHRPLHESTQAWKQFVQQLETKVNNFELRYPHILLR